MLKDIKNILIIVLFIVLAILLFKTGCNKPGPDLSPKSDTIPIHDTIWGSNTIYKFKPLYKPKWDTVTKIDTIVKDLNYVRVYNDSLSDTNITIYNSIKTIGYLEKSTTSYKLKVPIKITNTTTITNTNIVTKSPKISIYAGAELGGNTSSFDLSPFINFNIKNNNVYYRYGVIGKTHNVGVGIKIFKSKK